MAKVWGRKMQKNIKNEEQLNIYQDYQKSMAPTYAMVQNAHVEQMCEEEEEMGGMFGGSS